MNKTLAIFVSILLCFGAVMCLKHCKNKPKPIQTELKKVESANIIIDSFQKVWKYKIDSIQKANNNKLSHLKTLTRNQIEFRYKVIPKVVLIHDTLVLSPLDTCKQSLLYYTTKLHGAETLLENYKHISDSKTKIIDTLQINLVKLADKNDKISNNLIKAKKKTKKWKLVSLILGAAHLLR